MADNTQDIYVNAELVICVFPAMEDLETGERTPSKTHTSIMLLDDTIINVAGGLERVIGTLRAAR